MINKGFMMNNLQTVKVNKNYLHSIIKNFREAFPVNFQQCGLELCDECEGSGLPIKPPHLTGQELTLWQPNTYCNKCKGFGALNIDRIYDEYLCKKCKGLGCNSCEFKGTVDWISNAVKK